MCVCVYYNFKERCVLSLSFCVRITHHAMTDVNLVIMKSSIVRIYIFIVREHFPNGILYKKSLRSNIFQYIHLI